jgi:hypothetical protein
MTTPTLTQRSLRSTSAARPVRLGAIAAALSLALGAAGCGGGSKSTATTASTAAAISKPEFVAKANAICASADPNLAAENATLAAHPTPAAVLAAVKGVYVPSVEAQVAGIKALGTPAGDQATVTRMLALVKADLAKIEADPALMVTSNAFGDFAKVAHGYGLTACAPLS